MSEEGLKTAKGTAREWLAWRDDEESGIDHEGHVSSLAGLLLDEIAAAHRRGWDEAREQAADVIRSWHPEDSRAGYAAEIEALVLHMPFDSESK